MPYLELKNVSKGFGGAPVLRDINLSVEKGEFVAIVGFSGAGHELALLNGEVDVLQHRHSAETLRDVF